MYILGYFSPMDYFALSNELHQPLYFPIHFYYDIYPVVQSQLFGAGGGERGEGYYSKAGVLKPWTMEPWLLAPHMP